MSLSGVQGTLSSLKSCQNDIKTGMDIVTDVAMDLAEAHDVEGSNKSLKALEDALLVCARLDRDIDHFVDIVQQVTSQASHQNPEAMFTLSETVKKCYEEKIAGLSDAELRKHQKVIAFKESIRNCQTQAAQEPGGSMEELDEDIAVSQAQVNFTCPLTQVEMDNPVRNNKCNHYYDNTAILNLIKNRHAQKKKCRCPVVGCGNSNVKESDLVPDQVLRRKIHSQKRSSIKT